MAGAGKPITIKIAGDEKDLEKSLLNAQKRLDALKAKMAESGDQANKTSIFHKKLGDVTGNAGNKVQEMAGKFTQHLGPAGDKAQSLIGGLTDKIGGMNAMAAGAAGGVALLATAILKIGETGVGKFNEFSSQTAAIKKTMGGTAEEASALAAASRRLGVDTDVVSAAMAKAAKNIETNEGKLKDYGITVAHTKDGNVDMNQTLYNAADAFVTMKDPAEKAAAMSALFGKNWTQLTPILAQGSAGLKDLAEQAKKQGLIQSDKDLAASKAFNNNVRELKQSLDGMWMTIGRAVVPQLAEMAAGAAKVEQKFSSLMSHVGGFGTVFRVAMGMASGGMSEMLMNLGKSDSKTKSFQEKVDQATEAMRKQAEQADIDAAAHDQFASAQDVAKAAVDRAKQAYSDYEKSVRDAIQADKDRRAALEGLGGVEIAHEKAVRQTNKDLETLTADYNDAQKAARDYGEGSKEAKDANSKFNDQLLTTESSLLSQVGAQLDLNQKTAEAAGHSYDAAQRSADYKAALENLASQMEPGNPLRTFLQGLIDKLNEVPSNKTINLDIEANYHGPVSPTGEYPTAVFRAGGGRLEKGQAAIVGEEGRELFIPDSAGTVIPTSQTNAMTTSGRPVALGDDGTTMVNHFTFNGIMTEDIPDTIVRTLREKLRRFERSIG